MSYNLEITTDADAGLVTLTINGTAIEIVDADIPRWSLECLPPRLTITGHHVQADEDGTEWVRTTAARRGMTRDNGEGNPFTQLYTTVVVGDAEVPVDRTGWMLPTGPSAFDDTLPEQPADADPGDIARDATPEEIAAGAASIPHHDDANDSAVDGG
ncbi:MAG: hypothetical protein AB7G36_10080 [Candidatus Nanopelagicales bacterium]